MPPTNETPEPNLPPEEPTLPDATNAGNLPPEGHVHYADAPEEDTHDLHVVEITTKDGKKETHHVRVGGTPGGVTAQQLADHLTRTDHFRGRAKRIVVKRGGRKAVKGNLATIVANPKAATLKAEVEPHPQVPAPTTAVTEGGLEGELRSVGVANPTDL